MLAWFIGGPTEASSKEEEEVSQIFKDKSRDQLYSNQESRKMASFIGGPIEES